MRSFFNVVVLGYRGVFVGFVGFGYIIYVFSLGVVQLYVIFVFRDFIKLYGFGICLDVIVLEIEGRVGVFLWGFYSIFFRVFVIVGFLQSMSFVQQRKNV